MKLVARHSNSKGRFEKSDGYEPVGLKPEVQSALEVLLGADTPILSVTLHYDGERSTEVRRG